MKDNTESWALFQIYDHVTERWSPVYCAPSNAAARLEVKDLAKRQPNRMITMQFLGIIQNCDFTKLEAQEVFNEEQSEVPAAVENV